VTILLEFFVLRAEPELSAQLAEALQRDPVAAAAAIALLREDRRLELISSPMMLAPAGERAEFATGYQGAREVEMSIEAVSEVHDSSVSLDLRLLLVEDDVRQEQAVQLLAGDQTFALVDMPDLLVAVRPTVLEDSASAVELLRSRQTARDQRLEGLEVKGERSRRRAVEALLGG
jgi:hypothetical protein